MSNEIKNTCKTVDVEIIRGLHPSDIRGATIKEECGIDLEGILDNAQTHKLLEVAKRTGSDMILSKEDVLRQAIVDEKVARVKGEPPQKSCHHRLAYYNDNLTYDDCPLSTRDMMDSLETFISNDGATEVLAYEPEEVRIAIQKRAERFMEDARALIGRLKK